MVYRYSGLKQQSKYIHIRCAYGNISKGFIVDNMKKIELNRYVFDFSGGYNIIDVSDVADIHKYLIKNSNRK